MEKSQSRSSLASRTSALEFVGKKSKTLRVAYDYEMDKFTNLTTFHGLVRWYNGNWKAKIFWTIIIGFAVTFFVMQSVNSWEYYAGKPLVTNVEFVDQNNGSIFPAITVCNYNPVKQSVVAEYNMSSDVLAYIIIAYLQLEDMYIIYNASTISLFYTEYQQYVNNTPGFSVNKFLMEAGYSCEDMFIDCTFAGIPMNCCQFARPVITNMGKCYQFQNYSAINAFNKQYISGPYYGFQAFINVMIDEYPTENEVFEAGIRAVMHPRNTMTPVSAGGLSCSPGFKLYAGVTQTQYILLPPEMWGQCKNKWITKDYAKNFNLSTDDLNRTVNDVYEYSTNNCEMVCIAHLFVKHCGCIPLKFFNVFAYDTPLCDPNVDLKNCSSKFIKQIEDNSVTKICPDCGIECERWNYDLQSSYIKISKAACQSMAEKLNMSSTAIRENLVVLNVYLTDVNYVKYQQVQATSFTATLSKWLKVFTGGNTQENFVTLKAGLYSNSLCIETETENKEQHVENRPKKLNKMLRAGSVTFNLSNSERVSTESNSESEENIRKLTMEMIRNEEIEKLATNNANSKVEKVEVANRSKSLMYKIRDYFSIFFKKSRSNSTEPIINPNDNDKRKLFFISA